MCDTRRSQISPGYRYRFDRSFRLHVCHLFECYISEKVCGANVVASSLSHNRILYIRAREREREMAGLQRSMQTFRRSGSSGLVWDDQFLSGDLNQMKKEEEGLEFRELKHSQSVGSTGMMKRSRGSGTQAFRTGNVSPSRDPPSPGVSGCMLCGIFGRHRATTKPPKPRRR